MKILMVSSFLPYPLVNGGNIRLYNLLKNLGKSYEVTLICEKRAYQNDKDIEEVKKFCKKIITVPRKKQWTFSNVLKSLFSLSPFLIVGHENSVMKKNIENELVKNNYDLIHVETFYVMQNIPKTNVPMVLAEHNVEYLVYKRYADHSLLFFRPFLYWDIFKLKIKEKMFWKKSTALIAVSPKEKAIIDANEIVPNGVDIEKFQFQNSNLKFNQEEKRILFIGDFKWLENRDTAKWIIRKIWPKLKLEKDSNVKLWIVGREIPEDIKNLIKDSRVIFDENAPEETSLIYKKAFLLLSPIRVGGGTSFKILEAMASGVPVVTTSIGAQGITIGKEIIVSDNVNDTLTLIQRILKDKKYYDEVAKGARLLIEKKYDWKQIVKKLENVYDKTLKI